MNGLATLSNAAIAKTTVLTNNTNSIERLSQPTMATIVEVPTFGALNVSEHALDLSLHRDQLTATPLHVLAPMMKIPTTDLADICSNSPMLGTRVVFPVMMIPDYAFYNFCVFLGLNKCHLNTYLPQTNASYDRAHQQLARVFASRILDNNNWRHLLPQCHALLTTAMETYSVFPTSFFFADAFAPKALLFNSGPMNLTGAATTLSFLFCVASAVNYFRAQFISARAKLFPATPDETTGAKDYALRFAPKKSAFTRCLPYKGPVMLLRNDDHKFSVIAFNKHHTTLASSTTQNYTRYTFS